MKNSYTYKIDTKECTTNRVDEKKTETVIADFIPQVKKVKIYQCKNKTIRKYVIDFRCNNGLIEGVEIVSDELKHFPYNTIDDSLLLLPTISTANAEMEYFIRQQAAKAKKETITMFQQLGWHTIMGKHCYCAGDIVIGLSECDSYDIDKSISNQIHLEIDVNMTERETVDYALQMIVVDAPATPIIFIFGMLGVMRQPILDAGINIPCALFLYGDTQSRKTEAAKQETQLYNRSLMKSGLQTSSLRVNSTEYKSEELAEFLKDATLIYDDLFKEKDKVKRNKNESHFRNLLRNFADNSARATARSSFKPNCQLIVTSEYMIQSLTDIGRLFLVEVKKPIDSARLTEIQKNPKALSTFYYFYIKWFAENYNRIVSDLKMEFLCFRDTLAFHKVKYARLYEQAFLLRFCFGVFLEYAKTQIEEIDVDRYKEKFTEYINFYLHQEKGVLDEISGSEKTITNFSYELLQLLAEGRIKFGSKGSDCFNKNDKIYITTECFGRALHSKYNKAFTTKNITSYFRQRYISEVYEDNRLKKYNGHRYLILDIAELNRDAENYSGIESLFYG